MLSIVHVQYQAQKVTSMIRVAVFGLSDFIGNAITTTLPNHNQFKSSYIVTSNGSSLAIAGSYRRQCLRYMESPSGPFFVTLVCIITILSY